MKRTPPPPKRTRGAAAIEFQIISLLVLIPLIMAIIQLGMFMIAKNTANVATLAAARAGAASGGDRSEMRRAFWVGLTPLYASAAKEVTHVGTADIGSGNYAQVMGAALAYAKADTINPLFTSITVLNPTAKSFQDWGQTSGSVTIIPVTNLDATPGIGSNSKQSRADALLLKIQTRYCYELVVPLIGELMMEVLNSPFSGASLSDRACYAFNRIPIESQATVRMTVPPVKSKLL